MKNRSKQHYASRFNNDQRGAAALLMIVVIAAAAVSLVTSVVLSGIDDLEQGFSSQVGQDTILTAESCVEEAILRTVRDASYTGGTLTVGQGSCVFTVTGGPCGNCTIVSEATNLDYTRTIEADISVAGATVSVTRWEEVP